MLKQTAEQRRGVKNRNELNWNLTGMVSYVHVAQSLSQSVKAVLVFLIYNRITVKPGGGGLPYKTDGDAHRLA